MGFGPKVRERRTALGFSQEHLAHRAGLSWAAIQRLEAGTITDPHYSTLSAIARALGATVAELAEERGSVLIGPKVDAPETGRQLPDLLEKGLDAARRDEEKDSHAAARAHASEGEAQNTSGYKEDEFRAELRARGFPDEHFERFIWPSIVGTLQAERLEEENVRLEEENARLREELGLPSSVITRR